MSYQYQGDSDNEDEDNDYKQFEIKDGHIFLIEVTATLLKPLPGSSESQLFLILQSINDLMVELVKTMRSTGVGIYFYNCDNDPAGNAILKPVKYGPRGFVKFFKLNFVNSANMKQLNDLITDDLRSIRSINHYFKYLEDHDTENLPLIFNKLLDEINRKRQFNRIKIHWITNNSTPFKQSATKEKLWLIINDYSNFHYFINPIFLKPSSQEEFDTSLYRDVFINTNYLTKADSRNRQDGDDDDDDNDDEEEETKLGSLNKQATILNYQIREEILRIKEVRRIQFACDLILSDGPAIGGNLGCSIKGYTLYNKETYKSSIILSNHNGGLKKVYLESNTVNQESGEVVDLGNPNSDEVSNSTYKAKSLREKKADHNIYKGHEIAGGDIVILKPDVEDFMTSYTFDHGIEKKESDKGSEMKDEFGFGIHDVDDDDEDGDGDQNGRRVKSLVDYSQPPYLKLIGFRDIDTLDISYNSKAPVFVTADMNNGLRRSTGGAGGYDNSFKTFSSLYQSCVKLKKYAILFGCIKKNAKPLLFSFYPTRIKYSTRNVPDEDDFPEGFLLLRLPYINDIRGLPDYVKGFSLADNEGEFISDELVGKYKQLFGSFYFENYIPNDYPNPSMNYLYKILQAELLQKDLSSEDRKLIKNDITSLKVSEVRHFLSGNPDRVKLVQEINDKLKALDQEPHGSESRQRFQQQADLESAKKRQKLSTATAAANAPTLDEEGALQAWKNDEFSKFTVAQLKQFQQKYRDQIKSATKKADLINNIKQFLDSREKR